MTFELGTAPSITVPTTRASRQNAMIKHSTRNQFVIVVTLLLSSAGCSQNESQSQVDPTWLQRWEEAVQQRPATLSSGGRIASVDEPGAPLVVHGRVVKPDGQTPAPDVIVFGYQTDSTGVYFVPDNAHSTWRLHGWVETDTKGRFTFRTIRPAAYPSNTEAAHIHFVIESDDFGRQWDPTIYFSDDPLVSEATRRRSEEAGEFGNVLDVETTNDVQHVNLTIRLKEEADF